ncbi:S49 family peptidase [Oceanomicrobium pacificus]|uniref:S49 family peptidase n=1 Tax=Oceanomicrobium pacificus TaxID=2692916 RepID=A0A6B0TVI9_9RHOB|nr:S49 family peptidase [Oceanomicrobium pacificus]MXU66779.1 S49 family peptidase [Oceanomicrobium pacificus]
MKRLGALLKKAPRVSVVRLDGVIGGGGRLSGGGLTDAALAPVLERAFSRGKPAAVALLVNSPGGSPAQSSLIAARIRHLAEKHEVPVLAYCEDVAASGGYWLACAADEIYADPNSILGSIGVIYAGFGFADLIARYGVERRVHTAGESKSLLDPFRPEKSEDVARLTSLQTDIHQGFIDYVKARRGDRLADTDLFTGDIWVGRGAVNVGLADGVAHAVTDLVERFGPDVKLVPHGRKRSIFKRLGAQIVADGLAGLEDRALWARYGL